MHFRTGGHPFGLHRVIEPEGSLPQAAYKLDPSFPPYDNEVVIAVESLNVDSASFHQIIGEVGRNWEAIGERIDEIVAERGKMQNPVTGSGGMLLGTVEATGPLYDGPVAVGDRIATLVSLTLTPLDLEYIKAVHIEADQVDVKGRAYLWPSSPLVKLPEDLPPKLALSVLDVAGAPAQAHRLCQGASSVLVMGAGKSGMLCAAAARAAMPDGKVYGFDLHEHNLEKLRVAGLVDEYACGDATKAIGVLDTVAEMTHGELVDVVINTCNVANTEMAAMLSCKDRGKVYFFNMATSFSRAALGAEGVGKDLDLLIGNGYATGHAEAALELVRNNPVVREMIEALSQS